MEGWEEWKVGGKDMQVGRNGKLKEMEEWKN